VKDLVTFFGPIPTINVRQLSDLVAGGAGGLG